MSLNMKRPLSERRHNDFVSGTVVLLESRMFLIMETGPLEKWNYT